MRRQTSAWTTAILGTALTGSLLWAQQSAPDASATGRGGGRTVAAAPGAPVAPATGTRDVRYVLRNGWDFVKLGKYERALALFREVDKRKGNLFPEEVRSLKQGIETAERGLREAPVVSVTYGPDGKPLAPGALDPAVRQASAAVPSGSNPTVVPLTQPAGTQVVPPPTQVIEPPPVSAAPATAAVELETVSLPPLSREASERAPAPVPEASRPSEASAPLVAPGVNPAPVPVPEPAPVDNLPPAPEIPSGPAPGTGPLPTLPDPAPLATAPPVQPPAVREPTQLAQAMPTPAPDSAVVPESLPPLPEGLPEAPEAIPAPDVPSSPALIPGAPPAIAAPGIVVPDARPVMPEPEPAPPPPLATAPVPTPEPERVVAPVPTPEPAPASTASLVVVPPVEPAPPPAAETLPWPAARLAPSPVPVPAPAVTIPASSAFDPPAVERREMAGTRLSPELRREVERIAQKQEEESFGQEPQPARPVPGAADAPVASPGAPTSRLELSRAPSATEARPLRAIPVPEAFVPLARRDWAPSRKLWASAALCHMPLYFQDASLERYGHSTEQFFGPAGRYLSYPLDDPKQSNQRNQLTQTLFSYGLFCYQIVAWPYNVVMDPPWEAEYDLGYYRPGDRVPTDMYYLPLTGVGPPLRGNRY